MQKKIGQRNKNPLNFIQKYSFFFLIIVKFIYTCIYVEFLYVIYILKYNVRVYCK